MLSLVSMIRDDRYPRRLVVLSPQNLAFLSLLWAKAVADVTVKVPHGYEMVSVPSCPACDLRSRPTHSLRMEMAEGQTIFDWICPILSE